MIQEKGLTIDEKNILLDVKGPFRYWMGESNETNKAGQPKIRIEVLNDIKDTIIMQSYEGTRSNIRFYN